MFFYVKIVYNGFHKAKSKLDWCRKNFVNHRTLYKAEEVRVQLRKYARRFKVPCKSSHDPEAIGKALTSGLFANAAKLQPDGSYKTIRGDHVCLNMFIFFFFYYPSNINHL